MTTATPLEGQLQERIAKVREQHASVLRNIGRVILGKEEVVDKILIAMCARGHVLLQDVPGVGKTVLSRSLAASVACEFKRIQFTPDLLPMDVSGSNVFDVRKKTFEFQPGPVFCDILLADEVNRATPKTQSALLEVMEERQVTIEGQTHAIEPPFQVIATMNPLDDAGTYALPAAQMDRFMMMLSIGYPPAEAEVEMLTVHLAAEPILQQLKPVVEKAEFVSWQQTVPYIFVSDEIKTYCVALMRALRGDERNLQSVSPRSTLMLMRAAQARAMLLGREFVAIEDVQTLAPDVLAHRLLIGDGRSGRELVKEMLPTIPVPA